MAGIYGILLKANEERKIYRHFYNAEFAHTVQEEIKGSDFTFGRSVLDKFNEDRFLYQNRDYVICFEGINYSSIKNPEDFIKAYEQDNTSFLTALKGNFSGFIFSKKHGQLLLFNDPLSTKDIYYFHDPKYGFAFSSEMHVLSKILRQNDIPIHYDYDGIYAMALYGQMFDDFTLVKQIKRMPYGSRIDYKVSSSIFKQKKYFRLQKDIVPQKLDDIIERIDELMLQAVEREWEKDRENGYQSHFALLSGGLDSRINILLAKELGFDKITGYTYGDSGSSDVRIAQQVGKENLYAHLQYNLDNGKYMLENILENYVKATDGLTFFMSNATIYNAFSKLNLQPYGLVHSGQIGDAIAGSLIKEGFDFEAKKSRIGLTGFVKNKSLLEKPAFLKELINRYQHTDYEIFAYEQRVCTATLMGDNVFNNFIDHASPFYDDELLSYSLSIPNKYKINQRLFFSWLQKKHPKVLDYKWERIGLKPNNKYKINHGRFFKKYVNGAKKYLGLKYDNMNPYDTWFRKAPELLEQLDTIFKAHLVLLEDHPELQKDLSKIYRNNIFAYRNKFAALTVLLGLKLHFES